MQIKLNETDKGKALLILIRLKTLKKKINL